MTFCVAFLLLSLVLELTPSVRMVQADAGEAKRGKCNPAGSDYDQWDGFMQRYNKTYANCTEENMRRELLTGNRKRIAAHNADAAKGLYSYTLGENELSDRTSAEYKTLLGTRIDDLLVTGKRRKRATSRPSMPIYRNTVAVSTLSATVDWRTQGWVSPVANQGRCGSCWAYATTGTIESQYKNKTKTLVQLSPQNLIDCSSVAPFGNSGCNGGDPAVAYWYVMQNGQQLASTYPSTSASSGLTGTCKYVSTKSVVKLSGWRYVDFNNEAALQQAVAKVGPVTVAIDASSTQFQQYSGGVFNYQFCSTTSLNHAVQVVGYGTYNGIPYWLIKNSWGTSWGQVGYMMMARNANNMCGIAAYATFPVVSTASG